jgi:protein subunit release factor B
MSEFPVTEKKSRQLSEDFRRCGIKEKDITEKFILSGSPGGQKADKSSSAVYLKHEPSGTEVKYRRSRSRALNRFMARRLLAEKIAEKIHGEKTEKRKRIEKIKRQKRRRSKKAKEKVLAAKKETASKKDSRSYVRKLGREDTGL